MKLSVNLLFVCCITFSSISFAEDIDYESQIKLIDSAAIALIQYHPRLSKELTEYVHDRALWRDETNVNKSEAESEKAEILTKKKKKAHIKLLRDSAAYLRYSNPELAKTLVVLADKKAKMILKASSVIP